MDILSACKDRNLFAPWFRDEATWQAWFAFLAAFFALPMTDEQLATYRKHTGCDQAPTEPHTEAWLIVGRRGGKSFIMALVAVFLACFREYRRFLQPGERATVMVIATDRRQARVIVRYIAGMLATIPMLKAMLEADPAAERFDLRNQVTIEVGTASWRTTRGYTFAAVIGDEVAFWRTDDGANPDNEILAAVRPGLASIPGSVLMLASSPYAKRGELWNAYRQWWGRDGGPLVWKATSREMNPSLRQSVVDEALARDYARAAAEYLAEFRSDVEQFVTREVVEACVSLGVRERPRVSGLRYFGFVDPSGGSNDAMTLAIAHSEGERVIVDATRERRPPFSPEAVSNDFAETLKSYGLAEVTGDRYGGEWPREQFRKHGVNYRLADLTCSDLYREMLPRLNAATVDLLDNERLVAQIVGLERRVARGGRESIGHEPNGHDDLSNAVAGVVNLAGRKRQSAEAVVGQYRAQGPLNNPLCGRSGDGREDKRLFALHQMIERDRAMREAKAKEGVTP